MNIYLQCLYEYIAEERVNSLLWGDPQYRQYANAHSEAGEALEAMLSSEQKEALERYQSAESELLDFESRVLFREAVALGHWLKCQN